MLQYQIDRIEHQVAEDRAQSGVFLIGPLERGQATTLGNALRRVLMVGWKAVLSPPSGLPVSITNTPRFLGSVKTFSTSC